MISGRPLHDFFGRGERLEENAVITGIGLMVVVAIFGW
jgi:hypothetical protein